MKIADNINAKDALTVKQELINSFDLFIEFGKNLIKVMLNPKLDNIAISPIKEITVEAIPTSEGV